ncbi:MAG: cation:proton antiporter [Muribaculaceae bacterium]|nr:cation:proton antiporter [Muribaculaceae bacterium]MDE6522208.1 cation:proton antiporter [Muribaculaceae bacterium]
MIQETTTDIQQSIYTELNPDAGKESAHGSEDNTNGLILDLAWILVLAAISTLVFKKLKQPVVLGYILAGFIASPNFTYLPSISNLENIEIWADLGIVVLMFSLGLEFSFKKLMNSGSSAIITALIIIVGMTLAGFGVGYFLHLNTINCIFLGGMISMSSTTIILKAFTDLGLKQQKFASMVLAVLIIEDLFAVLMLVLLSSFAMGDVQGSELIFSIAKLCFFLIIWFVVGVYLLPSFLDKVSSYLNSETLLVVSMGLCFMMAAFSVMCGFSLELGAFVMGSILAGTVFAERMEHVITPVKDLFGAVFFISVGMMVQPSVIVTYYPQILLLAAVVIVGMIIFGTLGMLVTGQTLQVAIKSGFSLTQIGEFSFIIASLGMGLGVLDASLYPIIVAVSVITIFTTPYFIKLSTPAYNFVEKHLPEGLKFLITRYSSQVVDTNETRRLWREILGRYIWRIVLYSVILIAIIFACRQMLFPLMEYFMPKWGHLVATAISLVIMSPFLTALSFTTIKSDQKMKLHQTASFYEVPLIAMSIIRYILALLFVVYFLTVCYSSWVGWIGGTICFFLLIVFASSKLMKRFKRMEKKFMNNLNNRENARSGANNNLVSDLHQAFLDIKPQCRFAGDKLKDSGLRSEYGVSVSSIRRGDEFIPLPTGDTRIFPGDTLGIIGTDSQIKHLNDVIDNVSHKKDSVRPTDIELKSILLTDKSPIIDRPLYETDLRNDYFCMVISVQRDDNEFINPGPTTVLKAGDLLWIVGDPAQFDKMK